MSEALATVIVAGAPFQVIFFIVASLAAVAGAVGVISSRDPFVSALSLIVNFGALGGLYLALNTPFLAVAQVIVYTGAVVVLFLFVIAYLGDNREVLGGATRATLLVPIAGLAALGFIVLVAGTAWNWWGAHDIVAFPTHASAAFGSVASVGQSFMTRYTLEFEAVSLVLLVAAIGGVTLGLTGRAQHAKLRRALGTRSADQQRRVFASRDPQGAEYERDDAARDIAAHGYQASNGDADGAGKEPIA